MTKQQMPWSFYSTLISFGVFFACLNIYILTKWLAHPLASEYWLIGVIVGFIWLIYSIRMVRVHQKELIEKKVVLA
ncbi:MAG: hypothetical protein JW779_02805 [Candidatus Thorarchaeota archaeon]|nr:hypothetical protein [Candidatus Thorarchaeota archaeon]